MLRNTVSLSSDDSHAAVEPDNGPAGLMIVLLSLTTIVLFGVGYAVKESLQVFLVGQQVKVDLSVPNPELTELQAKSQADLSGFAQVDAAKGFYKIPVDRAMDALVRNQSVIFK
jgi:hypothetical protein